MGLVITVSEGERFNVGVRKFVLEETTPSLSVLAEIGGCQYEITDAPSVLGEEFVIRRTAVDGFSFARLRIDAPDSMRIWRGTYMGGSDAELLAPVPLEHLQSGRDVCEAQGRVAFGSNAWENFRKLDLLLGGGPCRAWLYASDSAHLAKPMVSWSCTYLRHVESRAGRHPYDMLYRPASTAKYAADNAGHWAVFWEVTDLQPLGGAVIPVNKFFGHGNQKPFASGFLPKGPMIVEPTGGV
jgi:hypothetical protein